MKKSIYISGIVSANLLMFGSLFKVQHWPGAGILIVAAILLFCFHFLPAALISSYKNQEEKKFKLLHFVTFIVFFTSMMGVLFKVMHWPGAGIFLLIGLPLPFVFFLPVYLFQTRKEKNNTSSNFTAIMFGLTFLALFSVLLALNVSRGVLESYAVNINNNENSISFNEARITSASQNEIKQTSADLCAYIDGLKCALLTATENNVCKNDQLVPNYNAMQIYNMENTNVPFRILFGEGKINGANMLKVKIDAFHNALVSSDKISPDLRELVNTLFASGKSNSEVNSERNHLPWGRQTFTSLQLIVVLDVLTEIQSNVRFVEAELIMD
jgi:hypothetical protein